jgi:hypothetical protein
MAFDVADPVLFIPDGYARQESKEGSSWCGPLIDGISNTTMMLQSSLWILYHNIKYCSQNREMTLYSSLLSTSAFLSKVYSLAI